MKIDKMIEIFILTDDFFKEFNPFFEKMKIQNSSTRSRNRKTKLSPSEIMTIYICFHLSHYTNLKAFYTEYVQVHWCEYFPSLVSYERFNTLQKRVMIPLLVFLKNKCMGDCTGISFIDSTRIEACHIKREKQHKVLSPVATKGKSTMGWFYGFKLHLIVNDKGEILSYSLSKANTDDRNIDIIQTLCKGLVGKLYGDRGYISKSLADFLWNDGVHLVYKRRKNMKKQNLSDTDKILLRKRALIECVNDQLKNICSIQHTRHRSLHGFINNLVAGLCAYHFLPKKPSLNINRDNYNPQQLLQIAA